MVVGLLIFALFIVSMLVAGALGDAARALVQRVWMVIFFVAFVPWLILGLAGCAGCALGA
jgi:hypothetical protein